MSTNMKPTKGNPWIPGPLRQVPCSCTPFKRPRRLAASTLLLLPEVLLKGERPSLKPPGFFWLDPQKLSCNSPTPQKETNKPLVQIPGASVAHAAEVVGRRRRLRRRRSVARHALVAPEVQEVHVQVLVPTAWRALCSRLREHARRPKARVLLGRTAKGRIFLGFGVLWGVKKGWLTSGQKESLLRRCRWLYRGLFAPPLSPPGGPVSDPHTVNNLWGNNREIQAHEKDLQT